MTFLDAALSYAARGWAVFPLKPKTKEPATRHGFKDATKDERAINALWAGVPMRNVGIACGEVSGVVVIDVDGDKGREEWAGLVGVNQVPETLTSKTGSGGMHILFQHPGLAINNSPISQSVHVRADGGYIVAAPSIHPNGNAYEWVDPSAPVALIPGWLFELLESRGQKPDTARNEFSTTIQGDLVKPPMRYAERGLENEIQNVLKAGEGNRNNALNTAAFSLGTLIGSGALDRFTVEQQLLNAALTIGLSEIESLKTIKSGIDSGMKKPREVQARNGLKPDGVSVPKMDGLEDMDDYIDEIFQKREDDDTFYLKANMTDAGNAECLAFKCKEALRYDHTSNGWRLWDGQRWGFDSMKTSEQFAVKVVRARRDAYNLDKNEDGWKFALRSENLRNVKNMLESAQRLDEFKTNIEQYDQNRMLACAGDYTLDLADVSARENRREDYITLKLGADYDANATCPRWIQFINELFPNKPEMVAYVQRAFGYCLTGDTREQQFFMCHGGGRNGKSTFLEVLGKLAGEYSGSTGFETFDADTGEARGDLAELRGCRVVTVIESDEDKHLAEARVKSITGGDKIVARKLYAKPFSYKPQFKLWLAMNHLPTIRGADEGIWRRVHLIPFTQNFEGREDKTLGYKLITTELSGILNWALEGLCQWHEQGLNPPDEVRNATLRYRADSDIIGQWIESNCVKGEDKQSASTTAYQNFRTWSTSVGISERFIMAQNRWGRRLNERGYISEKKSGKQIYFGFGLIEQ